MAGTPESPFNDAINDNLKKTPEFILQKMKVPFISSFIFSWLGINWERVAIMLLSKENVYTRIREISNLPQINAPLIGQWHTNTFFMPLLYAIIITVLTPFFMLILKYATGIANSAIIKIQAVQDKKYEMYATDEEMILTQKKIDLSTKKNDIIDLESKFTDLSKAYTEKETSLNELKNIVEGLKEEEKSKKLSLAEIENSYGGLSNAKEQIIQLKKLNSELQDSLLGYQRDENEYNKQVFNYQIENQRVTSERDIIRKRARSLHEGLKEVYDLLLNTKTITEGGITKGTINTDYLQSKEYKLIEEILDSLSNASGKIYSTLRPTGSDDDENF